jgi:hypothetical protein
LADDTTHQPEPVHGAWVRVVFRTLPIDGVLNFFFKHLLRLHFERVDVLQSSARPKSLLNFLASEVVIVERRFVLCQTKSARCRSLLWRFFSAFKKRERSSRELDVMRHDYSH